MTKTAKFVLRESKNKLNIVPEDETCISIPSRQIANCNQNPCKSLASYCHTFTAHWIRSRLTLRNILHHALVATPKAKATHVPLLSSTPASLVQRSLTLEAHTIPCHPCDLCRCHQFQGTFNVALTRTGLHYICTVHSDW